MGAASRLSQTLGEHMAWAIRIGLGVLFLAIIGAGFLAWYAGTLTPPQRAYHQVLTHERTSY